MKVLTLVAMVWISLLSGCANLYSGIAQYTVEPFYDDNTKVIICCKANVISGKNAGSVKMNIIKKGEDFIVDFNENSVNASESIAASSVAIKSVSDAISNTAKSIDDISTKLP